MKEDIIFFCPVDFIFSIRARIKWMETFFFTSFFVPIIFFFINGHLALLGGPLVQQMKGDLSLDMYWKVDELLAVKPEIKAE